MAEETGPTIGQGPRPRVRRPWPRLPRWFVAGTAAALAGFTVLGVAAVQRIRDVPEQPLFERRSPPRPGELSHEVGRVTLPDAPIQPVRCGVVAGLSVQGGSRTGPLLADAVRGLCNRLGGVDPALADRIVAAARLGTVISFANFGRTGELSTTMSGRPPRVLVNDAFIRNTGQFKGFLVPILAHELWHGGVADATAEEEYAARVVEARMCDFVPSSSAFRGCVEARAIVKLGRDAAVAGLRAAGYR